MTVTATVKITDSETGKTYEWSGITAEKARVETEYEDDPYRSDPYRPPMPQHVELLQFGFVGLVPQSPDPLYTLKVKEPKKGKKK